MAEPSRRSTYQGGAHPGIPRPFLATGDAVLKAPPIPRLDPHHEQHKSAAAKTQPSCN